MLFYDTDWALIDDRANLHTTLSKVTRIDEAVLRGTRKLSDCSIAERMSWASHRETKRIEDIAYCLLGIFDVNMPLLYGERGKAFNRLQEEIIRQSADESIFAWQDERIGFLQYPAQFLVDSGWDICKSSGCDKVAAAYVQEEAIRTATIDDALSGSRTDESALKLRPEQGQTLSSMLAKSPKGFQYAGSIVVETTGLFSSRALLDDALNRFETRTFKLTNRGLKTKRHLVPWSPYTYFLPLNCRRKNQGTGVTGILLRRLRSQETQYAIPNIICSKQILRRLQKPWFL